MKAEWKPCVRLGTTLFALYLCIYYWPLLSGFCVKLLGGAGGLITGAAIAYILNILMSFYERHYFPGKTTGPAAKSRRGVCILVSLITLGGVVFLVIRLVVPELFACVSLLFSAVPEFIKNVIAWVNDSGILTSDGLEELFLSLERIDWQSKIAQMVQTLLVGFGGAAQAAFSTVSSAVSFIAGFVISLIFSLYLLSGKERLGSQFRQLCRAYLPQKWNERLGHVLTVCDGCFHKFIVGQCTEAVILGLLCIAGMTLLRFPYAVMIGTLIGFTALIPVAGAYIGAFVGAFMILTVSPLKAIGFLVFIVILQQLEGNLIYPKVVGTSIGLPGVWVLATVTVGGAVGGIGGMLLGVPLAASAYQLLRGDVNRRLNPGKEGETTIEPTT